jgi:hypothetical protein
MGAPDSYQTSRLKKPDNSETVGIADGDKPDQLSPEFTARLTLVTLAGRNNKLKQFFKGLDV